MVFLNSMILTLIGFLPFPDSETYSDFTTRGGETKVFVTTDSNGARLQGNLLGIIGQNGKRVGFVGIRTPIKIKNSPILYVSVEGINEIKARAVFSTVNRYSPNVDGELSYQCLLVPTNLKNIYRIDLKNLVPTVRGRELPTNKAPLFNTDEVLNFALEIKLSEQVFKQDDGLDFDFKVFWKTNIDESYEMSKN